MDNYQEGILYDPDGNEIYEGLFMNNNPKEGKNLKLYRTSGNINYEGNILNGEYHGHGILYGKTKIERNRMQSELQFIKYIGEFKNHKFNGKGQLYLDHYLGQYLFYEGNFVDNKLSGNGKMFYQNKDIFYEGQFENNDINGKGIKYYKNGKIKNEGIFSNNLCIQGIYYSPDGEKLYEGEFKNDIPIESKNIIIYDNNTNKIYEGEIHNRLYEGEGIEYCPLIKDKILFKGNFKYNLYEIPIFDIKRRKKNKLIKTTSRVILVSDYKSHPGKTCFLYRIKSNQYITNYIVSYRPPENTLKKFCNNNIEFFLNFSEPYFSPIFGINATIYINKFLNIVLYFFNMNGDDDEINIEFIEYIKKENENVKIYIVGNQIDSINKDVNLDIINKEYFEKFNNKIIEAMNKNLVDKYFEISVKT